MLFALYRALRERRTAAPERIVLGLVVAAMIAIALGARAVSGFDSYAEAGYAKLGLAQAYAPPSAPFGTGFSLVSTIWGVPMPAATHGPGWIALISATAGHAATAGGAIFTLRVIEAVALLALIALLARRNTSTAALVAFNPALYVAFVSNAQPDLFAATLLIGALAAGAALPLLAAALVACAGLIKLPMLLLAPVVFARPRGALRARILWTAVAMLLGVLVSLWLGGPAYFARIGDEVRAVFVPADRAAAVALAVRCALLIVAGVALVTALLRGVVRRAAAWSFVALAPVIAPAALAWTLPFAALARPSLTELLIVLPLAAALLDTSFPHAGLGVLAAAAMLVYAIVDAVRRRALPVDVR